MDHALASIGDRCGAETSPSGFDLQFAADLDSVDRGAADYIREFGDVIGALQSVLNNVTLSEIERQRIRAQLERARAGQPPLPPAAGAPGSGLAINWQMVGLAAVGIGAAWFLLGRRRR